MLIKIPEEVAERKTLLRAAGYGEINAELLAYDETVNLATALKLISNGCPQVLAMAILL